MAIGARGHQAWPLQTVRVIRRLAMSYSTLICIQPPSDMEGRSIGCANHRRWPAGVSAVRNWVS